MALVILSEREERKAPGHLEGERRTTVALSLLLFTVLALPETPAGAAPALYLPWTAGQRMYVLQGQNQGSHLSPTSKYAYDFSLGPFDSTSWVVRAAGPGRVAELREDHPASPDCDGTFAGRDNHIVIDHGDGTGAVYRHLARDSVLPAVGTPVARGDPLGLTGHSGLVCGTNHLHFTTVDLRTRVFLDVPFSDLDTGRDGGRPQTDRYYVSANTAGMATGSYRILLPYTSKRSGLRR